MGTGLISKIEYIDNKIVSSIVGFTTDESLCATINTDYNNSLGDWVNTHKTELENETKSISEFFATTPYVHEACIGINYEVDYPEITNISQL